MKNLFLYLVTVAIWGSTWYAITFQLNGTPTQVSVAYRFALATLILFVWCWLRRIRLRFSGREHFIYLALFGSVIAFSAYLTLVGRIGSDRAAYTSVLFPIVALLFSAAFEKYHLTLLSALGIACVLGGNGLVLLGKRRANPTIPIRGVETSTKGGE